MHPKLRIWLITIACVISASLLLAAVYLYRPIADNPSATELSAAADRYSVEILRDKWGVPHIVGDRDADVSFGLAYAHAEDDFETIQETLAATRGVLARYRGKNAAATDYIVHLLGVWETINVRYQNDVPDDVKAIAEAYVAGLNLYAARFPEKTWTGLAPFTAEDVVAGFIFKTPFFYGLDKVLLDLFDEQRTAEIALGGGESEQAWEVRSERVRELGSNALAVRRARSSDGKTRLLINSHQPMTGPVAWYEAHLISKQTLNISGGLFPGTPVILHGFNDHLGWANTVNHIDLSDSYVLTVNPENPKQYRLDNEWLDFELQEVEILVHLFGPFYYPARREVLRSEHGPVIEGSSHTFALRYAGMGEVRQLEQYFRLNQAQNFQQFTAAMSMNALPSINYVYADKDDTIAFIHNAQYPKRVGGPDWRLDLAGDRRELIWDGYLSYAEIPKLVNPKSGLVFNANNTPFAATDGDDNLAPSQFASSMGLATDQTNRSLRLMELTDGVSKLSKQDILDIKFDLSYSADSKQVEILKKFIDLDSGGDQRIEKAQRHLKMWNYGTDQDNRHAALAILSLRKIYRADDPDDHEPATLRTALSKSYDYLEANFDSLDVAWGDVNRLVRGQVNLPLDGGPDILRAIYAINTPEGEIPYATHGDTWMALVEWDEEGQMQADVVHQFGSATKDSSSPHYADQAPLFANKQFRKALTTLEEVEANAVRRYRP